MAYNVWGHQIHGAPAWTCSARFAIALRAGTEVPLEQIPLMMRRMLADRFNLVLRRETRVMPVFELVRSDAGLKIAPMKDGGCITLGPNSPTPTLALPPAPMPNICGWGRRTVVSTTPTRVEQIEGVDVPMSDLIRRLEPELGRIIIDRTAFTENFAYRVAFTPSDASLQPGGAGMPMDPTGIPGAEPIGHALKEQLGLELKSTQGTVDVLIIERIERPTPN